MPCRSPSSSVSRNGRCRIPRRPHPNLDYFFGRLERTEGEMIDDARAETADLDHPFRSSRQH
jgi:hypothetical protein